MEIKTIWHKNATQKEALGWLSSKESVLAASKDIFSGFTAYEKANRTPSKKQNQKQEPFTNPPKIEGI